MNFIRLLSKDDKMFNESMILYKKVFHFMSKEEWNLK